MKPPTLITAVLAATVLALSVMIPAIPASAATPGVWATWTNGADPSTSSFVFSGTAAAAGAGAGAGSGAGAGADYAGTVAMTKSDNANLLSSNGVYPVAGSSYFSAASPVGLVFGANGPTGSNTYRDRVSGATTVPSAEGAVSTTVFTFTTPVPVGDLGIAIQGFDQDRATISATDVEGNPVGYAVLFGGASTHSPSFNECNFTPQPTDCLDGFGPYTEGPVEFALDNGVWVIHQFAFANVGADVWLRPAVAIRTLTIVHTSDDENGSSAIDVSLAMLPTIADLPDTPGTPAVPDPSASPAAQELATTGANALPMMVLATALAMLGTAALVVRAVGRRRRSE